ncbi:hypothetical protein ACNOYE_15705 [Nannocystaceae bacterium ST9]
MSGAHHPLSRRTWLLASGSLALLGVLPGCRTREATRVPEGGPAPAAPLSERGIRNLLALTELSAALRWLHPSEPIAWEPVLLAGVRELELAEDPEQLAEGLRAMLAEAAPTVQVWRAAIEPSEDLEALACPDPEAEDEPSTRAREQVETSEPPERKGPPARTTRAAPEDASESESDGPETGESDESETGESDESETGESDETETGEFESVKEKAEAKQAAAEAAAAEKAEAEKAAEKAEVEKAEAEKAEAEKATAATKPEAKPPLEPQPRPDLPAELLRETDAIVQWRRVGFPLEARDRDPIACAERVVRPADRCVAPPDRRGREPSACRRCDDEFELLAPAAPMILVLARGLSAAIPLALWHPGGELSPPARFTAEQAAEYTLDDRGTRLLAVIQTWSVLRWFSPHAPRDPIAPLRRALCRAAALEVDAMPAILDELLAGFADGNAARIDDAAAREFVPAAGFAWASERVVALPRLDHHDELAPLEPGDVIVAIAGVPIETALAESLARASGSLASARITRAVDRLFVRDRAQAKPGLRVEVLRGEARTSLTLEHWLARDAWTSGGDRRPAEELFELDQGLWYADLGRIPDSRLAARWLREAKAVIVDLRGPMLDDRRSLAAHWLSAPIDLYEERALAGPNAEGRMTPVTIEHHRLEPVPSRRRLRCPVAVLADARTRGRAERELIAFDRLGMRIVGSASAGDLARTSQLQLPGGLRVRFSQTDALRHDGTRLAGAGVAPTRTVEPSWPAIGERDQVFDQARALLESWG